MSTTLFDHYVAFDVREDGRPKVVVGKIMECALGASGFQLLVMRADGTLTGVHVEKQDAVVVNDRARRRLVRNEILRAETRRRKEAE